MKKRAAIYARVSTNKSDPEVAQHPENQLVPLRDLAAKRDYSIVEEYVEHQSAAGKVKRKVFQRMMDDADRGSFDVVLFWSLDRFSREGVQATLDGLQRLTRAGVGWVSHQEQFLDSLGPFRDAVIGIIACLAQIETDRRSERAKAAIERKRKEGTFVGGQPRKDVPFDKLKKLLGDQYSIARIAKEFGVSRGTVVSRRKEYGLYERRTR